MYYRIANTLVPCSREEAGLGGAQYAAVLTNAEWEKERDSFDMFIDMDSEMEEQGETKAVVNYDSLTGCFSIPDRKHISSLRHTFSFALDEKGVVFIDDSDYVRSLLENIRKTRKWRLPGMERLLYDLLEEIIAGDMRLLEGLEHRLNVTEERILADEIDTYPAELNDIRGDLLDLRVHYEQLIDLGQELQENENGFFLAENLRYFKLFTERVERLKDTVTSLRDYIVQLRDLVQSQLSVKQNRIMTLLTIIATIFMPLTLIVGWHGMNFRYMPELELRISYPLVIVVSLLIVAVNLIWFKKKKWL